MLSNFLGTTYIAEVKALIRTLKRNIQHQRMTLAEKSMLWPELIGEATCPALQSRMQRMRYFHLLSRAQLHLSTSAIILLQPSILVQRVNDREMS